MLTKLSANRFFSWFLTFVLLLAQSGAVFAKPVLTHTNLLNSVTTIDGGGFHTCVLTANDGVQCWGDNSYGQLGDGTYTSSPNPVQINSLVSDVAVIDAGDIRTCVVTIDGGVLCWGENVYGGVGDGTTTNRNIPTDVTGLTSGIKTITVGRHHTCALTTSGGVKCWGYNGQGQLGNGATTDSTTPLDVIGLTSGVLAITAGGYHTCALTTEGGIKCWGDNSNQQIGIDRFQYGDSISVPVDVSESLSGMTAISAGMFHTCALTENNGVKCWGSNYNGEIGADPQNVQFSPTPLDVSGLTSDVSTISSSGYYHTCALTYSGGVKCWGDNHVGALGDNSTTDSSIPVETYGLTSNVIEITSGGYHNCVLSTNGTVKCWGWNAYGQIGDGTTDDHITPVVIGMPSNYVFSGFLSPVNNPNTVNIGKAGKTYPVKWQLKDINGIFIDNLSSVASITYKPTVCSAFSNDPTDALEVSSSGNTQLRYDSKENSFIYNWKTPSAGCYTLFLKLDTGQLFSAYFNLK